MYCPVSGPALVCTAFLSKCSPLQDRQFGSVPVSQWLCAVGSNGHVLFCFTFYLTLRSTTFIVHNQLAGLWCWDIPYCSSLFCHHSFFFHLRFLSNMFSISVLSVALCVCASVRCLVLACLCVCCFMWYVFSCIVFSLFSSASSSIL